MAPCLFLDTIPPSSPPPQGAGVDSGTPSRAGAIRAVPHLGWAEHLVPFSCSSPPQASVSTHGALHSDLQLPGSGGHGSNKMLLPGLLLEDKIREKECSSPPAQLGDPAVDKAVHWLCTRHSLLALFFLLEDSRPPKHSKK